MKLTLAVITALLPSLAHAIVAPFADPVELVSPLVGDLVETGDLDEDGDPDLLLLSDNYIWLLNRGDGQFLPTLTTNATRVRGQHHVGVADMDGDGDLDIIYLNSDSHEVGMFINTNNRGSYTRQLIAQAPDALGTAAAGDIDGDGDIDIVLTDRDDNLVLLARNQGNGVFDPAEIIAEANGQAGRLPGTLSPMVLGDFNGDGRLDIGGRAPGSAEIWELRNTPTGFQPRRLLSTPVGNISGWALHCEDVDRDGDDDLVFGSRAQFGQVDSEFVGFLEMRGGNGVLQRVFANTDRQQWYNMTLGDFDLDGDLDLIRDGNGRDGLYLHEFDAGRFGEAVEIEAPDGNGVRPLHPGIDLDGDGDEEMLTNPWGGSFISLYDNLTRHEAAVNEFSTNRDKIESGQSATLSWDVSLADRIEIDPGVGDVTSRTSIVVRPPSTTTYTLRAFRGSNVTTAQLTIIVFEDTDGDGLEDNWERLHFGSLDETGDGDPDGDDLPTLGEFDNNTDPNRPDTDGDGVGDGDEVELHGSNPLKADSDSDGAGDAIEIAAGSDPLSGDSKPSAFLDKLLIYSPLDAPFADGTVPNLSRPESGGILTGAATVGGDGLLTGALKLTGQAADGLSYPQIAEGVGSSFAVSFWFSPTTPADQGVIVRNSDDSTSVRWAVTSSGSTLEFAVGGTVARLEGIRVGEWNHALFSVEGSANRFSAALNGVTSAPLGFPAPALTQVPGTVEISAGGAARLDELAVWTRALDPSEMAALSSAPALGFTVASSAGPLALPAIELQPQGGQRYTGQDIELTVRVSGLGPVAFEWRRDGVLLTGEDGSTLSLVNLVPGQSGGYSVSVRNTAGVVESAAAELLVIDPVPQFVKGLDYDNEDFGDFGLVGSDLCGDLLAIGAPIDYNPGDRTGSVYVFGRDEGGESNWGQIARIVPPEDSADPDGFGRRVAVDRNRIAIGGDGDVNHRQRVHIYEVDAGGVMHVAQITDNPGDQDFGVHLDLFGDTLAVSAWNGGEGRTLNGRVHIYQRQADGEWLRQRTITASASTLDDHYGWAVALSEDTLAVSARDDWDGQRESGAVYIYERDLGGPGRWGERQKLKAGDITRFGTFGGAVALSADTMVVGGHLTQNETFVDYVFKRAQPGAPWIQRRRYQFKLADWVRTRSQETIAISGDLFISVDPETETFPLRQRNLPTPSGWGLVATTQSPPLRQFEQSVAISGDVIFVGPDNVFEQPAVAPSIKHQPVGQSVRRGQRAEFSVYGLGSRPLSVQWHKDGAAIPGATADVLVIEAVGESDPGSYHAVVGNAFGEVASRMVQLESDVPAAIVRQPAAPTRGDDGSFSFEVEVEGTDVQIQWLKNGVPIPGATAATLILAEPEFADAAVYSVEVSNLLRTVRSSGVELSLEAMMPLQLAKLLPAQGASSAGRAVDLSGSLAIVGATNSNPSGSAYIYEFDRGDGIWKRVAELRPPAGDNDHFGEAVAISGEIAVVGAPWTHGPGRLNAGAVYVFRRTATGGWDLEATLPGGASNGRQGQQVAIAGGEIFVGSRGSIQQFTHREGGQWVERVALQRPGADGFGNFLAVHNGVLVAGVDFDDRRGEHAGSAFVFEETAPGSGEWVETAHLFAPSPVPGEHFGRAVAVHGGTIAIGAVPNEIGGSIGSVYMFERGPDGWRFLQKLRASDGQLSDSFGSALALDGGQLLISASGDDSRGSESGAIYLFEEGETKWEEVQKMWAFDAEAGDLFGLSAALESGNALVGATRTEGGGGAYLLRISPTLLSVSSDGVPVLSRQTGLYEQKIVVRNESTEAVPAMKLLLNSLPEGIQLYNGSADNGRAIHFDHTIPGLGEIEMVLELYVSTRGRPSAPLLSVVSAIAVDFPPTAGAYGEVDRVLRMESGAMLVEFRSEPGRSYQIQYSADMKVWNDAVPPVKAAGTRVQWLDQGAPKTAIHPSASLMRWYRVTALPD